MKYIKLTKGKFAIVDDEDFDILNSTKWYFYEWRGSNYAVHSLHVRLGVRKYTSKTIRMHKLIMNPPEGFVVDHINGNGLDNRRSNLRICTRQQNQRNMKKRCDNKSGFKGVVRRKDIPLGKRCWKSRIKLNGRDIHLGYFYTPEEAAIAYNKNAKNIYGDFAKLNIV